MATKASSGTLLTRGLAKWRRASEYSIQWMAANRAVITPTHATTVLACSDTSRNTWARTMRNTPAVTIVAA